MAGERWIFTKSQLVDTPSRKCGIDSDKELMYRQQAANLIQDMGQRLSVQQLCINTAIVYIHRFYMFHSFTKFHRNMMAAASLFLAAKVEEQPRKLEHVIKVLHMCLNREGPPLDVKSVAYLEQAHELVTNENILLQTLGFDLSIDHPHTNVVKTCQLVKAPKDLAQTSYFLATNSLHLTTLCLQYKPTVVACVCVDLACKWSNWEIPPSNQGKPWYYYVDQSVTQELLTELTQDFLNILDKCPSKLRKKIMAGKAERREHEDVDSVSDVKPRNKSEPEAAAGSSGQLHKSSSKSHHHNHSSSGHDKKPDKQATEITHVKAETKPTIKQENTLPHTHGTNLFESLSEDGLPKDIKKEKEDSPSLSSSQIGVPQTPMVQKTSLAEYKERREREKQAALSKSASNLQSVDKNKHVKPDTVHKNVMQPENEKIHKSRIPEGEKLKKIHHERHASSKHGVETVHGFDTKLRIKSEPGLTPDSVKNADPKFKIKTESSVTPDRLQMPDMKLRIKKEVSLTPEPHADHSKQKIKQDLNKSGDGANKGVEHRLKTDIGSAGDSKTPELKMKIKTENKVSQEGSSPLKLKIKTSHLPKDKHYEKYKSSPAVQPTEQKVPPMKLSNHPSRMGEESTKMGHHKSHKSSKHSHSSSETNGKSELKLHISLSKHDDKHRDKRGEVRKPHHQVDNPHVNSDVMSRKRPLSPTDNVSNETQNQRRNKVHRSEGMRRSSSSLSNHSVVSMDLSDCGSISGNDTSMPLENDFVQDTSSAQGVGTHLLLQTLNHAIESKKAQIAAAVNPPLPPPLPTDFNPQPPPPPPPPNLYAPQFSSASQQYGYEPVHNLHDIDFLDDTFPPLPGENPPVRPPSPPNPY